MIGAITAAAQALNVGSSIANVRANNIANINTPSFKSRLTSLSEMSQGGVGLNPLRINTDSGSLLYTGNPQDVSIVNRHGGVGGYQSPGNRSFRLDGNQDISFTSLDTADLSVDDDGFLYNNGEPIGRLNSLGGNLGAISPTDSLMSGYQVTSNVNIVTETVGSLVNNAYFKANALVITSSDDMMKRLIDIIG